MCYRKYNRHVFLTLFRIVFVLQHVLQNAAVFVTKCVGYHKMRRYHKNGTEQSCYLEFACESSKEEKNSTRSVMYLPKQTYEACALHTELDFFSSFTKLWKVK